MSLRSDCSLETTILAVSAVLPTVTHDFCTKNTESVTPNAGERPSLTVSNPPLALIAIFNLVLVLITRDRQR
nr:hypothetical protein L203_05968 [Cryptococcus depauperatus CBS 7841]